MEKRAPKLVLLSVVGAVLLAILVGAVSRSGLAAPNSVGSWSSQTPGSVQGNVLEIGIDSPVGIPDAWVRISNGSTIDSVQTSSEGSYQMRGLPSGAYVLSVSLPPESGVRFTSRADSIPVTVTPGATTTVPNVQTYTTQVTIFIDPQGVGVQPRVRVEPDPLYIVPGQEISWVVTSDGAGSAAGPFTVHFNPISPLLYRRKMAAEGETIVGQVRSVILPGKYTYLVAVEFRGLIVTEDPELIDENGEEPPPADSTGRGGGGL